MILILHYIGTSTVIVVCYAVLAFSILFVPYSNGISKLTRRDLLKIFAYFFVLSGLAFAAGIDLAVSHVFTS